MFMSCLPKKGRKTRVCLRVPTCGYNSRLLAGPWSAGFKDQRTRDNSPFPGRTLTDRRDEGVYQDLTGK